MQYQGTVQPCSKVLYLVLRSNTTQLSVQRELDIDRLHKGLCQCHYDILGVPRSATKNEIRKAYIKKSQEVMYFKFDNL